MMDQFVTRIQSAAYSRVCTKSYYRAIRQLPAKLKTIGNLRGGGADQISIYIQRWHSELLATQVEMESFSLEASADRLFIKTLQARSYSGDSSAPRIHEVFAGLEALFFPAQAPYMESDSKDAKYS